MFHLILLLWVLFHDFEHSHDPWHRFLYAALCHIVQYVWNHHPGVLRLCCCCRSRVVVDGSGPGRPVGATNKIHGEKQRTNKRRHTRKFRYADEAGDSAKRMAKRARAEKRRRQRAANAKSEKPARSRKRTAASARRGKQGKDKRRAQAMAMKREQQSRFAEQMRDQLSALVMPSLTIGQIRQLALTFFYSALAQVWPTRQSAAEFVASAFSVHPKTLLTWASELEFALLTSGPSDETDAAEIAERLVGCAALWQSLRGRHAKTVWLLADNEKQSKARACCYRTLIKL